MVFISDFYNELNFLKKYATYFFSFFFFFPFFFFAGLIWRKIIHKPPNFNGSSHLTSPFGHMNTPLLMTRVEQSPSAIMKVESQTLMLGTQFRHNFQVIPSATWWGNFAAEKSLQNCQIQWCFQKKNHHRLYGVQEAVRRTDGRQHLIIRVHPSRPHKVRLIPP